MRENKHVMIDLETLGKKPGCIILSIGAVVFTPDGIGPSFYAEMRPFSQHGLTTDASTMAWWQTQPEELRASILYDDEKKQDAVEVLQSFSTWYTMLAPRNNKNEIPVGVWGNGAKFDLSILEAAYDILMGFVPPWSYRREYCYRTLKGLLPDLKCEYQGTAHHALSDAENQARHAGQLLVELGIW